MNLKIQTIDLNVRLWQLATDNKDTWSHDDVTFFFRPKFEQMKSTFLVEIVSDWVLQIKQSSPKWVGLSCLSYQSSLFCEYFCTTLREQASHIKIMLGGPGTYSFGARMKELGLADAVVYGSEVVRFIEVFQDTPALSIPQNPLPNYDDFDLSLYSSKYEIPFDPRSLPGGLSTLFVTGSTGCVRRCSFCDVRDIWKDFSFRPADMVFEELKELNKRHHVHHFFFTDSLMNGTQRVFNNLCQKLAELNQVLSQKITFEGYLICRGQKQMNQRDFNVMAQAGLTRVYLGIESGSPTVRESMKKGYRQEDLLYFLSQCSRVGIGINMLLMIGYPTETHEDFLCTLNMITDFHQRGWLGPDKMISTASFNWTTVIPPGTPLHQEIPKLNIVDLERGIGLWSRSVEYVTTQGELRKEVNSPELRILRYRVLIEHLRSFGISLRNIENALQEIEVSLFNQNNFRRALDQINMKSRAKTGLSLDGKTSVHWKKGTLGCRVFKDIYFVFDPRSGVLHHFGGSEADTCELISARFSFDDICQKLAAKNMIFQNNPDLAKNFCSGFLHSLQKLGLVELDTV